MAAKSGLQAIATALAMNDSVWSNGANIPFSPERINWAAAA